MKDQWPITSMIVTWWIFNQWWPTPKNGHRSTAPSLYQTPHSFHKIFQYFSSAYKIMISLLCQMSGILLCGKKWCKPVYFIRKETNWFLYARLKNGRIMLWQCLSVRPSVRVFRTFFQRALRYQFQTWYMHLVGDTTCRVWVSSQLGHFDLVYSQM